MAFKSVLFICSFLSSYLVFGHGHDAFDRLSKKPVDYGNIGAICEQLMGLTLEEVYPKAEYDIQIGIVYQHRGRVLGELDLVVFRKATGRAVSVVEVKCAKSPKRSLGKAREQLARFKRFLLRGAPGTIHSGADRGVVFERGRFLHNPLYEAGSVLGSKKVGYDLDIPYTVSDAMKLRRRLMQCQASGRCPVPLIVMLDMD